MFVIIWQYEVRAGSEPAFEALYGPEGAWVGLFRAQAGYISTELLRDGSTQRYLTIDRWTSQAEYDGFLETTQSRYAEVDALGDSLTLAEHRIGRYETP